MTTLKKNTSIPNYPHLTPQTGGLQEATKDDDKHHQKTAAEADTISAMLNSTKKTKQLKKLTIYKIN